MCDFYAKTFVLQFFSDAEEVGECVHKWGGGVHSKDTAKVPVINRNS